jgi:hypothetical protein
MRNVKIRTSESVRNGLKISTTAIAERNYYMIPSAYVNEAEKKYYVTKITEDGEKIVEITVSESDGVFVYVWDRHGPFSENDLLLNTTPGAAPYRVSETKTGYGVYRANNGVAEYRKIILDADALSASSYVVLDVNLAQGIKAFDYIVTDAAGIEEGQIIR